MSWQGSDRNGVNGISVETMKGFCRNFLSLGSNGASSMPIASFVPRL